MSFRIWQTAELKTLMSGQLVNERRAREGGAQVRYHTLTDAPTEAEPGLFTLERVAQIDWRMDKFKIEMDADAPGEGLVPVSALAAAFPLHVWKSKALSSGTSVGPAKVLLVSNW